MNYVFREPTEYLFRDQNGHDGKAFDTASPRTGHLIIECTDKLTVSLIQREVEFNYYVLAGKGYFIIDDQTRNITVGDLVVIPPNTKYTFGGTLKMLLINTPPYSPEQEVVLAD